MNKKIILARAMVVIILIVFAALWFKDTNVGTIKIGVLSPLTGTFSSQGEDFHNGIIIAANQINKNGKIIDIVEENSASDQKIAISALNKLADSGISLFLSGPGSGVNLALVPIAEQRKLVFIPQTRSFKADDAGDYIFRFAPLIDTEAEMMAKHIFESGIKRVAVVFESSTDTSINGKDVFSKVFESLSGAVIRTEGFDGKAVKDFRTMILKLKESKPEGIFLAVTEDPAGPLMRQMRELKVLVPIFGWSTHESKKVLEAAGSAAESLTITAEPLDCSRDEISKEYCQAYKDMNPMRTPQYYGGYGHDALLVLYQGLKAAKNDMTKVPALLTNLNGYQGVMGTLSLDSKGNLTKKDFVFKIVKEGKFVEFK